MNINANCWTHYSNGDAHAMYDHVLLLWIDRDCKPRSLIPSWCKQRIWYPYDNDLYIIIIQVSTSGYTGFINSMNKWIKCIYIICLG